MLKQANQLPICKISLWYKNHLATKTNQTPATFSNLNLVTVEKPQKTKSKQTKSPLKWYVVGEMSSWNLFRTKKSTKDGIVCCTLTHRKCDRWTGVMVDGAGAARDCSTEVFSSTRRLTLFTLPLHLWPCSKYRQKAFLFYCLLHRKRWK